MSSIEDRVSRLERQVFGKSKQAKDWRSTIGKFSDEPFMDEVIDGALEAREIERRQSNEQKDRDSK